MGNAAMLVTNANAVDPARHVSQYAHTARRMQDGSFSGTPTGITQTKGGYVLGGTALCGLEPIGGLLASRP